MKYICAERQRSGAIAVDLGAGRRASIHPPPHDRDPRTRLPQPGRQRPANGAAPSGDHRNLPIETEKFIEDRHRLVISFVLSRALVHLARRVLHFRKNTCTIRT
jgi:hypothetical protein